jgi:hypothetical protein
MSIPIVLRSDRLTVEIAPPGSAYSGTRFDWSAFITQVTLDGAHTFCVPESYQPGQGTGGAGLCNEFGIDQAIGYAEARPGECFPKLGVGLLARPAEDDYSFGKPHEIVARFPVQVDTAPNSATFVVEPLECRGYAARLAKTVSVAGNTLRIDYRLDNVGTLPLVTSEYCHNFTAFDGHRLGPDYRLRFPYTIALEPMEPRMSDWLRDRVQISGADIQPRPVENWGMYCRPLGYTRTGAPQWELAHLPSGVTMRETDDFAPCRVAVWGAPHVISAEVFIPIDLAAGQAMNWSRQYEFTVV